MSEAPMTRARFEALAEAFGGEVARWPAAEREAAALLMSAEPAFVRAALERADRLDAVLDSWRPRPAAAALTDRVLAAAPKPRARRFAWLSPAALAAGLAAACAAGVIVGVGLTQHGRSDQEVAVTNTLSAVSSSLDVEVGA